MLLVNFDAVNIKFNKVNRLVYLMLIRWAVCVWLQCDSVLCEFTATFNLLAIVIITIFIINIESFCWPLSSFFSSAVLNFFMFLGKIVPNQIKNIIFRLVASIKI